MDRKNISTSFGIILAIGSLWGLTEFGAGMGLQKCATLITGALLTGFSFFWLSFIWGATRRLFPVVLIVIIAMLFKWMDALLLQVAWNHGSVLNPMFAFLTAMVGFILLIALFRNQFARSFRSRILVGGSAALLAMCMFPLVKFITGTPACTYAATQIPLAIYTAPIAVVLAMIMVPLGFRVASWYHDKNRRTYRIQISPVFNRLWSPAVFIVCVIIMIVVRII
jgi:hypothetical protein